MHITLWMTPGGTAFLLSILLFSTLTFAANIPVDLAFNPGAQTFAEDTCTPATVNITNNFGQAAPLTSYKTLSINQGPPSLSFYADSGCTYKTSSFPLAAGTSSYTFYMFGTAAGTFSIRALASGLQFAMQTETITSSGSGAGGGGGNQESADFAAFPGGRRRLSYPCL